MSWVRAEHGSGEGTPVAKRTNAQMHTIHVPVEALANPEPECECSSALDPPAPY